MAEFASILCNCPKCAMVGGKLLSSATFTKHQRKVVKPTGSVRPLEESEVNVSTPSAGEGSQHPPANTGEDSTENVVTANHHSIRERLANTSDVRNRPLFDGSKLTLMNATTMLLNVYGLFPTVSQRAMDELFRVLHKFILPEGNILPENYRGAKALIEDFLTPAEVIDVCPRDHVTFRGSRAHLSQCPECNTNRYEESEGSKRAVKSFIYMPIIPRLIRWYELDSIAKKLQSHSSVSSGPWMEDIFDSPVWKDLYCPSGPFNGDKRSLTFAISADGMDPYQRCGTSYSMCPIILRCFNLPSGERNKFGHMILSTIIPGPSCPSDLNPYLEPLVDELLELNDGVPCMDAAGSGEMFELTARVIMGVFDTPGLAKFTKNASTNAKLNACGHCSVKGKYSKPYRKTVYTGNRKFLPENAGMRNSLQFHGGRVERKRAPKRKCREKMKRVGKRIVEMEQLAVALDANQELNTERFKPRDEANRLRSKYGKKGLEEMSRLPYYTDGFETPVDLMHCVQGIAKKFFQLFTGYSNYKARSIIEAEHQLGRFETIEPTSTPWHLTLEEKRLADRRLLSLRVVKGFNVKPRKLFENTPNMKSIEWLKIFSHGIVKYAIRGMLGEEQMDTFSEFCDVVSMLTDYRVMQADLEDMALRVSTTMSKIERDFPIAMQTLVTHMLHHAPYYLGRYGPAYLQWMFGFERFNSFLKSRVLNRKSPEVTAIESYRIYEFCQTMALAGLLPEGAVTSESSNALDSTQNENAESHLLLGRRQTAPTVTLESADLQKLKRIGITPSANPTKYLEAKNSRNKMSEYTCREADRRNLCSSLVAYNDPVGLGKILVCQICHFLNIPTGASSTEEVARVEVYATREETHGLLSISPVPHGEHISHTYVRCSQLPPPLISAVEDGKIWLLDVNPRYLSDVQLIL